MATLTKCSTTMKQLKNLIYQGAEGVIIDAPKSVAEQFLLLKYMSAMARNVIEFSGGEQVKSFASSTLNDVFLNGHTITQDLKSIIKNMKFLASKLKDDGMDTLPLDEKSWMSFIDKVGYVVSMHGDVWDDAMKQETIHAAVGLSLIEAEIRDYTYCRKERTRGAYPNQIKAFDSLLKLASTDPVFSEFKTFFGVIDNRDAINMQALSSFIQGYAEKARVFFDAAYHASLTHSSDSWVVTDAKVYGNEQQSLVNLIQRVIETGNINEQDGHRNTLLHRACYENDVELAKLVINAGIDLNIKNSNGLSAYNYIFHFSKPEVLELLLEKNASVFDNPNFITRLKEYAMKVPEYDAILQKYFPDIETVQLLQETFGI